VKLALGTVQFGLDYGINNTTGKVPQAEVARILDYAHNNGISVLDTASAYGESEEVLGRVLAGLDKPFELITKYPANQIMRPLAWIDRSLNLLHQDRIYGYLFHSYGVFQEHPEYIDDFVQIKAQSKARKIGFSLYYPSEAEYILKNNIPCDIVQVPYNFFDQRFAFVFPELKTRGIEIYVRSVFLQGLFFIHPEKLGTWFSPIKERLKELHTVADSKAVPITTLCLGFAHHNQYIDKIVIGVDSLDNLKENIYNYKTISELPIDFQQFEALSVTDENIILPFNWKK
jgi:aryl-alcohol dehydrogenase-like predicted oxidoreductase